MMDPNVMALTGCVLSGITTLRFNFRTGIGRGHSSANDIRGAVALLQELEKPADHILLIGYSYGASVVASVADSIPAVSG